MLFVRRRMVFHCSPLALHAGSVLAGKTVAFFQVTGFVVAVEVLLPELALSVGQGQ